MPPITVLYGVESMERAGAEQVVLSLIRHLDRKRFSPVVCCLTEKGDLAASVEALGVPVIALGKCQGFDIRVIPRLVRVMRRYRVEIVHTHVWSADIWFRAAAKLIGVPVVLVTEHNVALWKRRVHKLLDRWFARMTDRIICVSEAVRMFCLEQVGLPGAKLLLIHNGIERKPFDVPAGRREIRAALGVDANASVVIIVARLILQKGHRYFLEAMRVVCQRLPSTMALIVGNGSARAELEQLTQTLGLRGRVRFLGERTDVPALLHASDVFVLSSLHEGLPISLLEAMHAGLPAVVTDVGGNREAMVNGETGYMVPPADAEALAEKIATLLTHQQLAASMGQAGQRRVRERFLVETMAQANQQLYETLLQDKGRERNTLAPVLRYELLKG